MARDLAREQAEVLSDGLKGLGFKTRLFYSMRGTERGTVHGILVVVSDADDKNVVTRFLVTKNGRLKVEWEQSAGTVDGLMKKIGLGDIVRIGKTESPPLKWDTFHHGAHNSYSVNSEIGTFTIDPVHNNHGTMMGYSLNFANTGGGSTARQVKTLPHGGLWWAIGTDGKAQSLHTERLFRSPQAAKAAASKFYKEHSVGDEAVR